MNVYMKLVKNLIAKSTMFSHRNIRKYTSTSSDETGNQIDYVLLDKRRHSSTVDVRPFTGAVILIII
jgi:hypothetical protein